MFDACVVACVYSSDVLVNKAFNNAHVNPIVVDLVVEVDEVDEEEGQLHH